MGANLSAAHPVEAASALASPSVTSPTKVEMADGRVMSYDDYVQDSIGRFMPAKSTRRSQAIMLAVRQLHFAVSDLSP